MRKGKRFAAATLTALFALGGVGQPFMAPMIAMAESSEVVTGRFSGFTWSFDASEGLLIISGSGELPDLTGEAPWKQFQDQIERIIFRSGITAIPKGYFVGCTKLSDVLIPATVVSIADGAFAGTKLASVSYEGGAEKLYEMLSDEDKNELQNSNVGSYTVKTVVEDGVVKEIYTTEDGETKTVSYDQDGNVTKEEYVVKNGYVTVDYDDDGNQTQTFKFVIDGVTYEGVRHYNADGTWYCPVEKSNGVSVTMYGKGDEITKAETVLPNGTKGTVYYENDQKVKQETVLADGTVSNSTYKDGKRSTTKMKL